VRALKPAWVFPTHLAVSAIPTVVDGVVYVGAWDGNFYSIDAATGNVLWQTFVGMAPSPPDTTCMPGIGVSSQSVVSGDTVYVGGGDSAVYALNRLTGETRWRLPLADPQAGAYLWSSMMLSGNALYVGIASLGDCPLVQGGLARIPLDDPTHPLIRYTVPDGSAGASIWSTPAIDEQAGLVYVTTGNADSQDAGAGVWGSALLVMDAATLEIRGYFFLPIAPGDADVDFGSSPTLFQTPNGRQFVAANGKDGMMYVLTRPRLSLAWKFKLAIDCISPELGCGSVSTPAFDGRTLFSGAGQSDLTASDPGSVYAINPVTQKQLWMYTARGIVVGPVTLTPGLVIVPTTKGLVILDAGSGAELWNDSDTIGLYSQVAAANGALYCTYVNGDIAAWGIPGGGADSVLTATPGGLSFEGVSGGRAPAPQTISVSSQADPQTFTVSSDSAWLTAGSATADTPFALSVVVEIAGLAPGGYRGNLTLTPSSGGRPIVVPVSLRVTPAARPDR